MTVPRPPPNPWRQDQELPLCFILFGLVICVSSVVSQVYSGMFRLAMLIVVVICVATVVLPQALVGAV